jgi:hypothetical protein
MCLDEWRVSVCVCEAQGRGGHVISACMAHDHCMHNRPGEFENEVPGHVTAWALFIGRFKYHINIVRLTSGKNGDPSNEY